MAEPALNSVAEVTKISGKPEGAGEATRKPPAEQKLFFWDSIIFYLASAILGLSVSNIVVDFLRPEPNAVACFTPLNYSRNQASYINNFCNDFLPFTENFSLALVAHGVLLLAPQYLWKAYFSARIDFFFNHAAKLETLREGDTGGYPRKNFSVVDYMHREFYERRAILIGYIMKLISQCVIAASSLTVSSALFHDFGIQFDCPDKDDPPDHIFMRTVCSYAKLRFVSILRWTDYSLLVLSILTICYGLWWCLLRSHPELGHQETSVFCYESSINSKHYKAKKRYRLKNDLHFLLVSLFASDAGLGRVFKSIEIADDISHKLSGEMESLDTYDSMRNCSHPNKPPPASAMPSSPLSSSKRPQQPPLVGPTSAILSPTLSSERPRQSDMEANSEDNFKRGTLGSVMLTICKGINKQQKQWDPKLDASKMSALDIGCGYHSYMFAIARCQAQVISIILDPYYKNQRDIFKFDEYHGGVKLMRIPTNLFGLPKQHKLNFSERIDIFTGIKKESDVEKTVRKFSLVVIGPLDNERKKNTVNQIIEMHSRSPLVYFESGSMMLIFQPVEVEGKKLSGFFDWEPQSKTYWHLTGSLSQCKNWLSDKDKSLVQCEYDESDMHADIAVLCGDLKCKFRLKTFKYVPSSLA